MAMQFGVEAHRLVDLSVGIVREAQATKIPLVQVLGWARVQSEEHWRAKPYNGYKPDFQINVDDITEVWSTTPCLLTNDRWGLSVFKTHETNWHNEYPLPGNANASLVDFFGKVSSFYKPTTAELVPTLQKTPNTQVGRFICFKASSNTLVPEGTMIDWDDPNKDKQFPQARAKREHGLIVPQSCIELDRSNQSKFPQGPKLTDFACLYLANNLGHWDQWSFCSVVQIKAAAEERDEVNRDPDGSLVLNALEFVIDSIESIPFEKSQSHLSSLRDSLIDFGSRNEAFQLKSFIAMCSAEETQLLARVVEFFEMHEPQDESTLSEVISLLPKGTPFLSYANQGRSQSFRSGVGGETETRGSILKNLN